MRRLGHSQTVKTERIETIDALMARYVAGALPEPARVLVEAHLDIRDDNRGLVAGLESLAGDALEHGNPVEISGRDHRLDAIFASKAPVAPRRARASTSLFPAVLRDFVGYDVDDVPWRTKLPGFREHDVGEIDGCHVNLFWIRPGRRIPGHTHEGSELTLVLEGAFSDMSGHYGRGDIALADESVDHRPVAGLERPCICFAVTDGPLRLTGPLHQRLGDIIGR